MRLAPPDRPASVRPAGRATLGLAALAALSIGAAPAPGAGDPGRAGAAQQAWPVEDYTGMPVYAFLRKWDGRDVTCRVYRRDVVGAAFVGFDVATREYTADEFYYAYAFRFIDGNHEESGVGSTVEPGDTVSVVIGPIFEPPHHLDSLAKVPHEPGAGDPTKLVLTAVIASAVGALVGGLAALLVARASPPRA